MSTGEGETTGAAGRTDSVGRASETGGETGRVTFPRGSVSPPLRPTVPDPIGAMPGVSLSLGATSVVKETVGMISG